MKKLITILVVMSVLVGFVFAADPSGDAQINISATVSTLDPAYRLTPKTITTVKENTTGTSATVGTNGSVALLTDMLLEGDASIVFTIDQIAKSRTKVSYDVSVTASDLTLNSVASGHTTNQKFAYAISDYKAEGIANELAGVNFVTTTKPSTGTFRFAYTGSTINADASSNAKVLGEFKVTWTGNADAEPGTYSAWVKITIATTT